jgi:hypothetical protein
MTTKDQKDFSPRCLPIDDINDYQNNENRQSAAMTNRGELIPCCWLDIPQTLKHPIMQEMLKVSKIDENETVKDILFSKEWREFAKNLVERNMDKVLPACIDHCKKRTGRNKIKIEEFI